MNDPKDKYDKVLKFIEMAVLSPKRVRYRDAMSSKHSKQANNHHPFAKEELKLKRDNQYRLSLKVFLSYFPDILYCLNVQNVL